MHESYNIPTGDGHTIYGELNFLDQKKDKLTIFVHGLTGNMNEHHYYNAVPFFTQRGYDVFRFNLYDGRDDKGEARSLTDCGIGTHANDLDCVYDQFKNQYKHIVLVGHSLGAPTILWSESMKQAKKIVFWDPSSGMHNLEEKECTYDEQNKYYVLHWGVDSIVSQTLIDDWKKASDLSQFTTMIDERCSFVFAAEEMNYRGWQSHIPVGIRVVVIDGADHCFYEEGTEQQLFETTYQHISS